MKRKDGNYVVCHSNRHDMLPTGFYNLNGRIVSEKRDAALFPELTDCMRFVEKYSIHLGHRNYIGFINSAEREV